ncbi:MAG: DUF3576 domain-containing protein [Pseudomonadota bacterium]
MGSRLMALVLASCALVSACGGGREEIVVEETVGGANPYLWRASLDTMKELPLISADSLGGVILYDWRSFDDAPDERIKATVYILDTRLRADGVNVTVSVQKRVEGEWVDADPSPDTNFQLENRILERARNLKAAEIN